MENTQNGKKTKSAPKRQTYASLRIRRETKRQIAITMEAINKKDYGRRIHAEDFLSLALSLVSPVHLEQLRESSLTNSDRLERDFRSYVSEHGPITRDEYLGKRLSGEIAAPHNKNSLTT